MASEAAAEMARKRAESLTPARRSEIASEAAQARWAGHIPKERKKRHGERRGTENVIADRAPETSALTE